MFIKRAAKKVWNEVSFFSYVRKITRLLKKTRLRAIIYGSPNHPNLGDQAQAYCIENWVKNNLPEYSCIIILQTNNARQRSQIFNKLKKYITKDDLIICHSGYHFCEMYPLHEHYEELVKMFPDNKVIIFPQTVNFQNESEIQKSAAILNAHNDCTLLCRDKVSYATAQKYYKNKLHLYPDIVTSLIGSYNFDTDGRDGVLFCLRNDKEALYDRQQLKDFIGTLLSYKCDITDTNATAKLKEIISNRKAVLEDKLKQFSKYRIIVTDRYHGTIFSLIAGTPVIVISSTDHKLSSGVDWFADSVFKDYIFFAKDLETVRQIIEKHYDNFPSKSLPPYFEEAYYHKFKQVLFDK